MTRLQAGILSAVMVATIMLIVDLVRDGFSGLSFGGTLALLVVVIAWFAWSERRRARQ